MSDRRFALAVALLLLVGLGLAYRPGGAEVTRPAPVVGRPLRLAFLGDSLTAGYGLHPSKAYPALVGEALRDRGLAVDVANHGVSGDTTAQGLARIDDVLAGEPDLVLVCLGVNDGVRRRPLAEVRADLAAIVTRLRAAGAGVALAGMQVPPLLPPFYADDFRKLYPDLATELGVPLLPFLLEGIAWKPEWNQKDRVHPTAEGQARIAAHVLAFLAPLVEDRLGGAP